jgi:hypothetical protein
LPYEWAKERAPLAGYGRGRSLWRSGKLSHA